MNRKRKILTVLLLSAVPAAAPPAAHMAFGALCDREGYPLAGNVALKGDTARPAPSTRPAAPADSAVPERLLVLRSDLFRAGRNRALAEVARFRPLCDGDGYPLVGNLASKGDRVYQPSRFCSDLRDREKHT
jgi:hypothetical protein